MSETPRATTPAVRAPAAEPPRRDARPADASHVVPAPSTPVRVLIADDEPLARRRLRDLLARHAGYAIVAECEDGAEAVAQVLALAPDLAFLDIRMPELDGVAAAEAIGAAGEAAPMIVFVTARDAHAVRAFDLSAVDYLLKPVDAERFDRALARATARRAARVAADDAPPAADTAGRDTAGRDTAGSDARRTLEAARAVLAALRPAPAHPARFVVRDARGALSFVRADEVERVEAEGNYVALWVRGRAHLVRETMKGIEQRLDPARFVRVHRSAIVNLDRVRRLEPWAHGEYVITMDDGTRLTSSRTHSARLQELLR